MSAVATYQCPVCSGEMWDETTSKFYDPSKNRPIAKCKNKACKGVIWPPKGNGSAPAPAARPAARSPQPTNIGGPLPYEQQETGAPPTTIDLNAPAYTLRPEIVALYKQCVSAAQSIAAQNHIDQLNGDTAGAVAAMSATLFIAASKK